MVSGADEPQIQGETRQSLSLFQLITRGDPACGVDVRPVSTIAAKRGRSAVWARRRSLSRVGSNVVESVRPDVRGQHPQTPGFPYEGLQPLTLASRRNVRDPKGGAADLNGEMAYHWRAVDQEGEILETHLTKKRDKSAALALMKKALGCHGPAEAIVTDGLKSYPAAMRELGNLDRHEMGRWAKNRVENSHLPFRRRERAMLRFRRIKTLQKFASVHANVHNQLAPPPFGSTLNATLSIAKPSKNVALPPWRSGSRSPDSLHHQRPDCIVQRAVRIRLTAPFESIHLTFHNVKG